MNCSIKSLYLCVKDMNRAIDFYENLFEQAVTVRDEIYSVFDINGFRLGLFAYEKVNEKHVFGNSCLPSIEVNSFDVLKSKLEKLEIVFPIKQIGANWVAEFRDSEGNNIEITTPIIN
ncbi:glyoxalase [Clostridium beijerinckii]|uniref:Glyoxalase n=1 Tax=Clostridium beijerinckii TaxID=1520 RepID=A0A0B5QJ17_CLOBE|nr:VOC family protein [Clostridium beijerinckii]AJH00956.1 glyoxalase [Clostridium beijerinckii]